MSDSQQSIFKTIDTQRRGTTSEEVVSQLREMIHQGQLRPGDRLPPERDLAKLLGVSRVGKQNLDSPDEHGGDHSFRSAKQDREAVQRSQGVSRNAPEYLSCDPR